MKRFKLELLLSRLLSKDVQAHSNIAGSCRFYFSSSLTPAESVAHILQSEFGSVDDGLSSSSSSPKMYKQKTSNTPAGSVNKGCRGPHFNHDEQHDNPQLAHQQILEFKQGRDNPYLYTPHCKPQGPGNLHAENIIVKHGTADSHSIGHVSLPFHDPSAENEDGNKGTLGNTNSETCAQPIPTPPGPCIKTSQDIIKLLVDRVNTQSWLALNKDIQDFNIEIKPKEVAWVLKVLKNPSRAKELFVWAAQRPGYAHDATCYAVMIESFGDSSDLMFLDDLLSEMEKNSIRLSISTVNRLIGTYAAGDEIDKAEQYFLKLQNLGMQPTAFTYKCMLQAFAKAGKCEKAMDMYTKMQKEGQPIDILCYNMLLDGLSRNGQAESAWKIFEEMKSCGDMADVYTYTILARSYGQAGKVGKALNLLEEMVQNGVEPNKHTYNTVLEALAKVQGKHDHAVRIFKKMLKDGIYPDVVSCCSILKALCRGQQVGQTRDLALGIKNKAVRKEVCEGFIKGLARMGHLQDVRALFNMIKADNLQPSLATYVNMIDALCRGGETIEATSLLKEVEGKAGGVPLTTYNTVLVALRNNNQVQEAYDIFRQMKERGPLPDVVSYNILIAGLTKIKQLPRAERLFEEMNRSGCFPNGITFNSLLHSFARLGDVRSVRKLLQMMHEKEVTPDIITYNCTIECFGKAGKPKIALKVFKEMKEKGVSPSFVTYNLVLHALAEAGSTDEALSVFEQMKEQGFVPDALTFTILRRVYNRDPQLDKTKLVEEIRKAGLAYELSV